MKSRAATGTAEGTIRSPLTRLVKHWPSEASQELPPESSAKGADEERLGAGSVKSRWGKTLMVQEGSMKGDYQEDTRGALW